MANETARFVAFKATVAEIMHAPAQDNGLLWNGFPLGRINLLGVVISIQEKDVYTNIFVDDGTGSVSVRLFGQDVAYAVGDVVKVVGRPRVFGQERYIAPEIMRKVDQKWIIVRKKERDLLQKHLPVPKSEPPKEPERLENTDVCIDLIRKEDKGDGVDVEVLATYGISEERVNNLLKDGTIFETRPGRVKVLE